MDKFVKDVFEQAHKEETERAAAAFANIMSKNAGAIKFAICVSCGVKEMAQLITAVEKAGLANVLHDYENSCLAAGFKYGFQAGRESMLGGGVIYEPRPDTQRLPQVSAPAGRRMS